MPVLWTWACKRRFCHSISILPMLSAIFRRGTDRLQDKSIAALKFQIWVCCLLPPRLHVRCCLIQARRASAKGQGYSLSISVLGSATPRCLFGFKDYCAFSDAKQGWATQNGKEMQQFDSACAEAVHEKPLCRQEMQKRAFGAQTDAEKEGIVYNACIRLAPRCFRCTTRYQLHPADHCNLLSMFGLIGACCCKLSIIAAPSPGARVSRQIGQSIATVQHVVVGLLLL